MSFPDLPAFLDELQGYVRHEIAAGFDSPDEIAATAVEILDDEIDPVVLRPYAQRLVRAVLDMHLAEQATWPAMTDCDRLDAAFAALEAAGIVCRQNFSCCGSCGAGEIWDEMAAAGRAGRHVRGYVFYHVQDTESAVEGDGLYLNYGAVADGKAAALGVAREVIAALEGQGLRTDWNGAWTRRIHVALDWKRRRSTH